VDPADPDALATSLISFFEDPARQAQMRQAALLRAATDLSWATISVHTMQLYQQVLERL
jgi:glycosyltransferase involved in cell wall biosynthesis